ncbi:MAG TPA: hypothetical protein VM221_02585 [Armatimonadota bacterium]|nr:hypothetical protein [Armatimonadota bacterium]
MATARQPVIAALALTAFFIIAALVHVSSYARLAQFEYQRQALVAETRCLEAANSQLRFDVERARAQERIAAVAQQWGMTVADPAGEVDYIILPSAAGAPVAGSGHYPRFHAVLRDFALARQVTSVVTTGWSPAVRTAAGTAQMGRPHDRL